MPGLRMRIHCKFLDSTVSSDLCPIFPHTVKCYTHDLSTGLVWWVKRRENNPTPLTVSTWGPNICLVLSAAMRVPGRLCPPGLPREEEGLHDAEPVVYRTQEDPF